MYNNANTNDNILRTKCEKYSCEKKRRIIMSETYFSDLTEKQKKDYIIKLLEEYPQCEKNLQSVLELIEDKYEHYKEYVEDKKFSKAVQYEMCEEEFLHLRKEVNKIFAVFTNDLKRILEVIQDDPYFQDCYLKAQELNQRATLYRKEVRKKLGDYKRMYHLYRIDLSKSDFVSAVNSELSKCLDLISKRQQILYNNPQAELKHYTIVIDELLALSEGVTKAIKDSFFSLLIQTALLGRSTKIHLLLVSQRFDSSSIPISCREQMNVLIQVGNINSKTTQFLFPDLDLKGIVIPQGIGTGLIQVIDSEHPFQIVPLLTPTFNERGGVK